LNLTAFGRKVIQVSGLDDMPVFFSSVHSSAKNNVDVQVFDTLLSVHACFKYMIFSVANMLLRTQLRIFR